MNWTTNAPAAKPLSALTQSALGHYGSQAAVLEAWRISAQELAVAKELEARLRAVVFELNFPTPDEGVNRTDLPDGYKLKADYPFNYRLANKEKETEKALDDITAISQQAGFIADRLIVWKPDISIKEYRLLNPDKPEAQSEDQKKILAVLAPILTITPGSPQLEIEAPKAKR